MCRQFLTLYNFCQCEVDAGYQACSNGECAGPDFESVTMQCFCDKHATKKIVTEKKHAKHQRKQSRNSLSSVKTGSSRGSWYSGISLVGEKEPQPAPVERRRWYRRFSGIF